MKIVMPIVGRGSRFWEKGYKLPKPLIEIRGKPMVKWATDSLPFIKPEQMIFIILKEQKDEYHIDEKLKEMYSDKITIIVANDITEGAACTVLLAKDLINTDEELIVYNTDQYFKFPAENAIKRLPSSFSAMIPVFQSTNPKWSYVKTDNNSVAIEVAEKVPISTNATIGLYYFRHGKDFVWAAQEMIRKDIRRNNEFYVCPVFNELIARKDKILALRVSEMWGLGSPEDVEQFEKYYNG